MSRGAAIARAGAAHARVIAALMERCVPEAWSARSVAEILALPGAFAWLALNGDEPVGYALAQVAGDTCEVHSIGVLPGARRRGVASALHRGVAEAAAGCARITLEVAEDNAGARAFYAALGYGDAGRRRGYYRRRTDGTVDALVLERPLPSGSAP